MGETNKCIRFKVLELYFKFVSSQSSNNLLLNISICIIKHLNIINNIFFLNIHYVYLNLSLVNITFRNIGIHIII